MTWVICETYVPSYLSANLEFANKKSIFDWELPFLNTFEMWLSKFTDKKSANNEDRLYFYVSSFSSFLFRSFFIFNFNCFVTFLYRWVKRHEEIVLGYWSRSLGWLSRVKATRSKNLKKKNCRNNNNNSISNNHNNNNSGSESHSSIYNISNSNNNSSNSNSGSKNNDNCKKLFITLATATLITTTEIPTTVVAKATKTTPATLITTTSVTLTLTSATTTAVATATTTTTKIDF